MKFKHYFDHHLFVTLIQGGLDKSSLLCLLDYFDHQVDVVNELKKYGDTKLNRHESVDTAGSKSVFYAWNWSILLIIYCLSQNSYPNIMDFLKFTVTFWTTLIIKWMLWTSWKNMAIPSWTITKVLTLQGPNLYFTNEIEVNFWSFIVCHKIPTLISWIF